MIIGQTWDQWSLMGHVLFFYIIDWDYVFWGEEKTDSVWFLSHRIKGVYITILFTTVDVDHLTEIVFVKFLTFKLLF